MAQTKIIGYKNIFGFVLPDWVDESLIRKAVSLFILAVIMLFVLFFVIWPKMATVDGLRATLNDEKTKLKALQTSQDGFNKLNEQIPENLQTMVLSAIPQTYSPENSIFLLRKIANDSGVSISAYKLPSGVVYSTVESKQGVSSDGMVGFVSYPIKITVSASVNALLAFINKVENSLPFGVVSDLNMQEVTKLSRSSSGSVHMDLEIKYFQAVLNKVDITKIGPFSAADLALVDQLSTYAKYDSGTGTTEVSPASATGTTNIFGF